MSGLEIKCPQPTRPSKRKASQLESFDDPSLGRQACKRHNNFSPPDTLHKWLAEVPPFLNRKSSRSDSFLIHYMDGSHYDRLNQGSRPRSAQPTPKQSYYQPISPQSLSTGSTFYPPTQVPLASYTPVSQSFTPLSSSFSESRDDPKKSNRVKSPSYRDELKNHTVLLDSYRRTIPANVQNFAQEIVQAQRSSPGFRGEELESVHKKLSGLVSADEDTTRHGFSKTSIFPDQDDYDDKIVLGGSVPWDKKALPHVHGFNFPPIVQSKPDYQYGYPRDSFDNHEAAVMQSNRLTPYSHPSSAGYWPFFVIEIKSVSRGGTHWVAENQNAGSGAHCVNSIQTLLNYTRDKEQRMLDSLAFSCVADINSASLWVHWYQVGDSPRFISSEVDSYHWKKPDDLRRLRSGIRNIIDWGVDRRLKTIKEALNDILPSEVSQWDLEDRAARLRQ